MFAQERGHCFFMRLYVSTEIVAVGEGSLWLVIFCSLKKMKISGGFSKGASPACSREAW